MILLRPGDNHHGFRPRGFHFGDFRLQILFPGWNAFRVDRLRAERLNEDHVKHRGSELSVLHLAFRVGVELMRREILCHRVIGEAA